MRYHLILLDWQKLECCIMPSVGRDVRVWEHPCTSEWRVGWYPPRGHLLRQVKNVYGMYTMPLPIRSKEITAKDTGEGRAEFIVIVKQEGRGQGTTFKRTM